MLELAATGPSSKNDLEKSLSDSPSDFRPSIHFLLVDLPLNLDYNRSIYFPSANVHLLFTSPTKSVRYHYSISKTLTMGQDISFCLKKRMRYTNKERRCAK